VSEAQRLARIDGGQDAYDITQRRNRKAFESEQNVLDQLLVRVPEFAVFGYV
jgi:hypothetical protein